MASYTRLLELLNTVEGESGDRASYFEARGAKNTQRLFEAGRTNSSRSSTAGRKTPPTGAPAIKRSRRSSET